MKVKIRKYYERRKPTKQQKKKQRELKKIQKGLDLMKECYEKYIADGIRMRNENPNDFYSYMKNLYETSGLSSKNIKKYIPYNRRDRLYDYF